MLRMNGVIMMMSALAVILTACALEPPSRDRRGLDQAGAGAGGDILRSDSDDIRSLVSGAPGADVSTNASSLDGSIPPPANCSIVQFCNAPGSDGTRCLQQGCSVAAAISECRAETQTVCGGHTCPWIFVTSSGQRTDLCQPASNSCIQRGLCGQTTSTCQCDSLCSTFGDCCPDGPC